MRYVNDNVLCWIYSEAEAVSEEIYLNDIPEDDWCDEANWRAEEFAVRYEEPYMVKQIADDYGIIGNDGLALEMFAEAVAFKAIEMLHGEENATERTYCRKLHEFELALDDLEDIVYLHKCGAVDHQTTAARIADAARKLELVEREVEVYRNAWAVEKNSEENGR